MNVSEWIDRVTKALRRADLHYGHGTDCAEDEAAWLVLAAAGMPPEIEPGIASGDGAGMGEREVDPAAAARIESMLEARINRRVPLAYLTGQAWFAGLPFEVDENVLVPRSPIAELIEEGFAPWRRPEDIRNVLDLCTGSGCIAVATAVHLPWTRVDAADISAEALAVAGRNVARHDVGGRVRLVPSDLFGALGGCRYDVVVTNPPYVPAGTVTDLPGEFRAEPEIGLASGADGLDACLRILLECAFHLEDQGILVCEVGESEQRLEALLPAVPFLWLEFSRGGRGVFLLEREQLEEARPAVAARIEERKHV